MLDRVPGGFRRGFWLRSSDSKIQVAPKKSDASVSARSSTDNATDNATDNVPTSNKTFLNYPPAFICSFLLTLSALCFIFKTAIEKLKKRENSVDPTLQLIKTGKQIPA